MNQEELLVSTQNKVTTATINREARRNALSPAVVQGLRDLLLETSTQDTTQVLCLTGAGDRAFCAGADLLASLSAQDSDPMASNKEFAFLLQDLVAYPKPIVARVNGHSLGGGFGLALACDVIIAQERAQFGTPEVHVGLFPMMISPLILRQLPQKYAMKMMLCGDKISAATAADWGIVNRVVPLEELDQATQEVLDALCKAAPLAQQQGKRAMRKIAALSFEDSVEVLSGHLASLMQTEDAMEGISAFLQKRAPEWKGK